MLFMDHIIPDRQLCKILDPLAVVDFFLFLFFLLLTENIGLCDHRKFDQRILKAFPGVSIEDHNFPWIDHAVII